MDLSETISPVYTAAVGTWRDNPPALGRLRGRRGGDRGERWGGAGCRGRGWAGGKGGGDRGGRGWEGGRRRTGEEEYWNMGCMQLEECH